MMPPEFVEAYFKVVKQKNNAVKPLTTLILHLIQKLKLVCLS